MTSYGILPLSASGEPGRRSNPVGSSVALGCSKVLALTAWISFLSSRIAIVGPYFSHTPATSALLVSNQRSARK